MKDREGSIAVVVCAAAFLLALGGLAMADAGSFLVARARAQAAADAAALAAVIEQVPALAHDQVPADAAAAAASRNGAVVVACECATGRASATVTVRIRPAVVWLTGWSGRAVTATATAEADEGLLTYRR